MFTPQIINDNNDDNNNNNNNFHNNSEIIPNDFIRHKIIDSLLYSEINSQHINNEDRIFENKVIITKKFLKENKQMFFTLADEGSVTVCIDYNEYVQKANILLSDASTYGIINKIRIQFFRHYKLQYITF